MRGFISALLLTLLFASPILADWKPAPSPLMTRWAKDVSPNNAHPEYPRPQMVREKWMNLNGLWDLATKQGEFSQQILVPFPIESALSGVGKHYDHFWYRRNFTIPDDWKSNHVLLHFQACDYDTLVYLNGKKLGSHRGGYDAFSFDITGALKPGEQQLIVDVTDTTAPNQAKGKQVPNPGGIMYTPTSGIWQTVWLEPVPQNYIDYVHIVPDVDNSVVHVNVRTMGDRSALLTASVWDGKTKVSQQGNPGDQFDLPMKNAHLWSPDDPHLYQLDLKLTEGGDHLRCYFAMRKISVESDGKFQRLMLNNKPIFMAGPLDQGFWPDGIYTAPTDEAMRYDLEMTKKLGFNMIRKHVKIEPQPWYHACDELGILVWQDMPSAFDLKNPADQKQFEHEMEQMIEQHRNSPCIVNWVVFNEGWGEYDDKRITDWVKTLDPTRLADDASGWYDSNSGDMNDMHKYPGPGMPAVEKSRAVVLGEFGGLGLGIDGHTWTKKNWGYIGMASRDELTQHYVQLYERLWTLAQEGLCASVYTQTTDVETECNGLMTYDREILKVDLDKARAANTGNIPRIKITTIVPSVREQPGILWHYTFEKPAADWFKPDFNDSYWKTGKAGFGTEGTPGAIIGTKWDTSDIWIRRSFDLPEGDYSDAQLLLHHDDDAEVYINGVLATKKKHYTAGYVEERINKDALATLKPGKNTIAIHCHQVTGGQYIDAGLVRFVEIPRSK